jgi:hypothetical protein
MTIQGSSSVLIEFERSGGFMGRTSVSSFNIAELPENEAEQILTTIEKINFTSLEETIQSQSSQARDQFTYRISIQTQEWHHTIVTGDASAPEEIQTLIKLLNDLNRSGPSQ